MSSIKRRVVQWKQSGQMDKEKPSRFTEQEAIGGGAILGLAVMIILVLLAALLI